MAGGKSKGIYTRLPWVPAISIELYSWHKSWNPSVMPGRGGYGRGWLHQSHLPPGTDSHTPLPRSVYPNMSPPTTITPSPTLCTTWPNLTCAGQHWSRMQHWQASTASSRVIMNLTAHLQHESAQGWLYQLKGQSGLYIYLRNTVSIPCSWINMTQS